MASTKSDNKSVLLSIRLTPAEAQKLDDLSARLNRTPSRSGRKVTRSVLMRMGIEMLLAQAAA